MPLVRYITRSADLYLVHRTVAQYLEIPLMWVEKEKAGAEREESVQVEFGTEKVCLLCLCGTIFKTTSFY